MTGTKTECVHGLPLFAECPYCSPFNILDSKKTYYDGRQEMRDEILAIVKSCLVRDPTLQKLAKQIEDMK